MTSRSGERIEELLLSGQAKQWAWQTPDAAMAHSRKQRGSDQYEMMLSGQSQTWPTAQTNDSSTRNRTSGRSNPDSRHHDGETLGDAMVNWATPNVPTRGKESKESKESRGAGGIDLQTQGSNWATPDTSNSKGPTGSPATGRAKGESSDLRNDTSNWPTAGASDGDKAPKYHARGNLSLPMASGIWPTASARDHKGKPTQTHRSDGKLHTDDQLDRAAQSWTAPPCPPACSRPAEPTTDDGLILLLAVWTRPSCPRLSPAFQWWLMGWPHPRTFFASAATALCPSAPPGPSSTFGRASWNQWWSLNRQALYSLVSMAGEGGGA